MALELNGTTGASLVQDGVVVAADLNSALSDTIGKVKAWVNFNGTGTVAIRDSYNVSTITDNGTGDYTISFTTAMVDVNYSTVGSENGLVGTSAGVVAVYRIATTGAIAAPTTNAVRVNSCNNVGNGADIEYINVAVFR